MTYHESSMQLRKRYENKKPLKNETRYDTLKIKRIIMH